MVVDESREALGDLTVMRIEETREHGGHRCLLLLDVPTELAVNVRNERFTDVLQPRFLGRRVRIVKRAETDAPGVDDQLVALRRVEVAKQGKAARASVAHIGGDLLGSVNNGYHQLWSANQLRHARPYCIGRAASEVPVQSLVTHWIPRTWVLLAP